MIRKRDLVTRRWPFSAPIRARRVLAIFTHATAKSTFSNFFERRRRARIDAENGHIDELRGRAYGYLSKRRGAIQRAIYVHNPARLSTAAGRSMPPEDERRMGRFMDRVGWFGASVSWGRGGAFLVRRGTNAIAFFYTSDLRRNSSM